MQKSIKIRNIIVSFFILFFPGNHVFSQSLIDYKTLISEADLIYDKPVASSAPPGPGKDPVISLFPAWPDEWDADFKLLSRGNFLIESSYKNGKVVFVELLSQSGSVCAIINPWTDLKVQLYRNGKKSELISGKILTFKTGTGENIKIIPKDQESPRN